MKFFHHCQVSVGLALGIGASVRAQPAALVLTPEIDAIGAYSEVTHFPVIAGEPDLLAALNPQASRRFTGRDVGYAPLFFDLDLDASDWDSATAIIRIDRVSAGGAGMRFIQGTGTFEVGWQTADTWIVRQTFRVSLPLDAEALTLEGTSGVIVMDWIQFTTEAEAERLFPDAIVLNPGEVRTYDRAGSGTLPPLPPPLQPAELQLYFNPPRSPEHYLRPYSTSPHSKGMQLEDNWPALWLTMAQMEAAPAEIRRKINLLPWAADFWNALLVEAETVLAAPPHFPMEPTGWRHDFYSRSTGEHFVYDVNSGDAYLDPSTGVFEYSAAQRRAWVLLSQERTLRIMRSLGLLYAVTGDVRYAEWVAAGVRLSADYIELAIASGWERDAFGGNAVWYQPLYDAAVIMALANSYGLTRDSAAYSASDHQRIREAIFENRVTQQINFLQNIGGLENMAAYAAAAVAVSGELYGREDWLNLGTGAEFGFARWLQNNVPIRGDGAIDGLWNEQTTFYHFYALAPMITLYELTDTLSEVNDARFRKMFEAPLHLADKNLNLHLMGDLASPENFSLIDMRMFYEYAAGRISEARYAPVLSTIYERGGIPRGGLWSLIFGPDQLTTSADGLPTASSLLPVSGFATFRDMSRSVELGFRTGTYRGGHDHPDRLSVFLSANGGAISPDLGEPGYGLRSQTGDYYRRTISHNTLFSNETDNPGSAGLEWRPDAVPQRARGRIENANGVRYERTVYYDPPFIILLDQYDASVSQRFGWAFHAYGDLHFSNLNPSKDNVANPPWSMPPLPDSGNGYEMLTDRASATVAAQARGHWAMSDGRRLDFIVESDGAFELTAARSAGNPIPRDRGTLVLRAPGTSRQFSTVLEVSDGAALMSGMTRSAPGEITVHMRDGTSRIYNWDTDRAQTYAQWMETNHAQDLSPDDRLPTADPDGLGMPNLLRFALGVNNGSHPADYQPKPQIIESNGDGEALSLVFLRNRRAAGVIYSLEYSEDLQNWVPVWAPESRVEPISADEERVRLFAPRSKNGTNGPGKKEFIRLKVRREE